MGIGAQQDEEGPILGINVTPLVDVTLVLLIVFLITARTIMQQGIPLDVPRAVTTGKVDASIAVTIDERGAMTIDGRAIANGEELVRAAKEARARSADVKAVIHAPPNASHGAVVGAMDALRRAEVTHIAIATQHSKPE
jgi:biopolymer transport protein ExbD